ncbi:MAG: peptidase C11 [Oscillospiraceae bacterium]|nr:peptidase C11 [Oscillospiraceae bacterium]
MDNRPRGREKNITGQGKDIGKHGSGLGTGPVGSADGHAGRPTGQSSSGRGTSGGVPTRSGGRSPLTLIILALVVLLGGGGGLGALLGGSGTATQPQQPANVVQQPVQQPAQQKPTNFTASDIAALLNASMGNVSTGWSGENNNGAVNNTVATGARAKRTQIRGNGQDTVTILVYMCGTDLESKYGMATSDLSEMASATTNKLNIIVYTGGCRQWRNNIVSPQVNQIYKIEQGGVRLLEQNMGNGAMTNPDTLASFIQYGAKNFPANRMELIFWDHGGGSISGYGYDEKYGQGGGSMGLSGINKALKAGGITFDFIGFDTCLMATLENALMLDDYADYMIASEETEPGVGWFYTNWLTKLNANTSMPTLEIGKNIVDDFVAECARKCRGQDTTLSVVDLAELSATAPQALNAFAQNTSSLIQSNQYQAVSRARSGAREFAAAQKIDQVDLVDLANNLNTAESKALSKALLGAIKYNKTSSNLTDAYGLSIYFPYQRANRVNAAAAAYDAIGMDDDYTKCIQQFASMGVAGQAVSQQASPYAQNPLGALLSAQQQGGSSATASSDMIGQLLGQLLASSLSGGRSLPVEDMTDYIAINQFDSSNLYWDNGLLRLPDEQWWLVNDLEFNVFYDDGEGYIDLGLDNVYDFTDDGALKGEYDGTWLAIDDQPIAYYHTGSVYDGDNYAIMGRVPVLLNGDRADLLIVFDNEHPNGYIAGARSEYLNGETETVAKGVTELTAGDEIVFLCDYYDYDGTYQDSYRLVDEPWLYHADAQISNVYIDESKANATYRFTDIYGQNYWTPVIP